MKQLKTRLQLTLGRMRTKQRTQQKEIEKELDNKEGGGGGEDGGGSGSAGDKKSPIYCRWVGVYREIKV